MNTAISTLEIPQGATELTLDELKLISGGCEDDNEAAEAFRRKFKLEKVIVVKVFKRRKHRNFEGEGEGDKDC